MGIFTFEDETTSPVAPATLYKALVTDADNVIPKAVEAFRSVENLEGNGGPGTIKKITFVEDGESKFVLHKIESVDEANLGYSYSVVGGVGLPDTVEKITFECKLAAGANGGSAGKLTVKYQTKGDAQPNPDDLKIGKVKSDALFKAALNEVCFGYEVFENVGEGLKLKWVYALNGELGHLIWQMEGHEKDLEFLLVCNNDPCHHDEASSLDLTWALTCKKINRTLALWGQLHSNLKRL
ncbi:hypothetical protein JHK84_046340 [Glycine max]|nr:hypothetical protein JHK84_046340 [Glycine max]